MSLNETNILCEALEHFIARQKEHITDPETVFIAECLLSRYTNDVCARLTDDYRARLH